MRRTPWLLVLAACAGTADPVPVEHGFAMPESWLAGGATGPSADAWWTAFGDERLVAVVDRALSHNHDIAAAAARLDAAAHAAAIAGAGAFPELGLGLDASRSRRNFIGFPLPGGGVLSSTSTSYGASLNLSWELDVWGRVRSGRLAAAADVEVAAAELYGARLSLIAQTGKAWFACVESTLQRDLAERTVASSTATLDLVRRLYESGARPALDLRLARANVAAAQAAVEQRREQFARAIRQVQVLAGSYPDGELAAADDLPRVVPAIPVGVPSDVLARRPDLVAAERALVAAGARLDEARASLYPRLSLTASGGTASDELADLLDPDFRVWSLAGNLLQPLFQGGRLRADVARNEALVRAAAAGFSGALLRACAEVETALATEGHLAERERALGRAAEEARAAHELASERYELGLVDFLAVADSQRQALQQESLWLAARLQRLTARIDLHLALGGGFPAPEANGSAEEERP